MVFVSNESKTLRANCVERKEKRLSVKAFGVALNCLLKCNRKVSCVYPSIHPSICLRAHRKWKDLESDLIAFLLQGEMM